jgi:predicted secreted hydrolase
MADSEQGIGFTLSTRATKPLALEGPNGYSVKAEAAGRPAAASEYYSFTRLSTAGTLRLGGRLYDVRGESWMDKEFGSGQLAADQAGWDWFSLQLDDGREIMLYLLRNRSGAVDHAGGTWISRRGEPHVLAPGEFHVTVLGTWKSPSTGAEYPSRWAVEVTPRGPWAKSGEDAPPSQGLRFEVQPEVADQENRSRLAGGLFYWEGAVRVASPGGETLGRGFVELTGYGTNNRPAL